MAQLFKKWTDKELEESIIAVGPQLPVYIKAGFVIDGKRRQAICKRLRIAIDIVQLPTEHATLAILWAHHPERAFERMGPHKTLQEYSTLLGVKPAQVAEMRQGLNPPKKPKYKSKTESLVSRRTQYNLRMPTSVKALLKAAADAEHRPVGDLIRRASVAHARKVLGPKKVAAIMRSHKQFDLDGPIAKSLSEVVEKDPQR